MKTILTLLILFFSSPLFCHAYQYEFAKPVYESGWLSIAAGEEKELSHNLGGNLNNYVVDLQIRSNVFSTLQLKHIIAGLQEVTSVTVCKRVSSGTSSQHRQLPFTGQTMMIKAMSFAYGYGRFPELPMTVVGRPLHNQRQNCCPTHLVAIQMIMLSIWRANHPA